MADTSASPCQNSCHPAPAPILDRRTRLLECRIHFHLHHHSRRLTHLTSPPFHRTSGLSLPLPCPPFLLDLEESAHRALTLLRFPGQLSATGTPARRQFLRVPTDVFENTCARDSGFNIRAEFDWIFETSTGLDAIAGSLIVARPDSMALTLPLFCLYVHSLLQLHSLARGEALELPSR
jgi:hypothetical protein